MPDEDFAPQLAAMSDEYLKQQITALEKEALKLEAQLKTTDLKERAKMDKLFPFSIKEHDDAADAIYSEYTFKKVL